MHRRTWILRFSWVFRSPRPLGYEFSHTICHQTLVLVHYIELSLSYNIWYLFSFNVINLSKVVYFKRDFSKHNCRFRRLPRTKWCASMTSWVHTSRVELWVLKVVSHIERLNMSRVAGQLQTRVSWGMMRHTPLLRLYFRLYLMHYWCFTCNVLVAGRQEFRETWLAWLHQPPNCSRWSNLAGVCMCL